MVIIALACSLFENALASAAADVVLCCLLAQIKWRLLW